LSKNARCRALQLPTWNEALGLPRPWDQQWSLRIQQILAYETDILDSEDIFDGSRVIEGKTDELKRAASAEVERVIELGGVISALGYIKEQLVASHTERLRRINSGELTVVGVNKFTETAPSPLYTGDSSSVLKVDEEAERDQLARLAAFRTERNQTEVTAALTALRDAAVSGANVMPASIHCAQAGVTTGEWAQTLRSVFGEFRAPTGVGGAAVARGVEGPGADQLETLRARVRRSTDTLGRPLKVLIGKPGLDGHSNGAEQIAVWCRDAGMEVVYEGIRLTPDQIVTSARDEGVHLIGLSILSGSHLRLVPEVLAGLKSEGLDDVPVVVGGIIPEDDAQVLRQAGVARVYTPKDFEMLRILSDIVDVAEAAAAHG
jgi:(2R)-ethylmalonyl-CoA mutase